MSEYVAFYKKRGVRFDDYELPKVIKAADFANDYSPVMHLEEETMGDVYEIMQGEVWSPYGEARQSILELGLAHTSMSVGDIIWNVREDKYFLVAPIGFKEVKLTL